MRKDLPFLVFVFFGFIFLMLGGYAVGGKSDVSLAEPLIYSLTRSAKASFFWWKVWLVVGEFIYVIGNAFAEEIVFRGPLLLLRKLSDFLKIRPFVPIVLTSITFSAIYSLLHLRDTFFANLVIFGLGLLLSAITCKYNKMMPAVFVHTIWNITIILSPYAY